MYSPEWPAQYRWQNSVAQGPEKCIGPGSNKEGLRMCSKTRLSSTTSEIDYQSPRISTGSLSPPERINHLKIGEQLDAFRISVVKIETDASMDTQYQELRSNFTIERVSYLPDAFVLRNYLSSEECDEIIAASIGKDMTKAETITEGDTQSRTHCQVSWIPSTGPQKSELVSNLVSSTANLLLSKDILTNPSAGVEDLQVLKYEEGGEFVLHHDGEPRVLTVIYYVNGVGGTWFPLARTSDDESDDPCKDMEDKGAEEAFLEQRRFASQTPLNKREALRLGEGFLPGKNGLLVQGRAGSDFEDKRADKSSNEHVVSIERGDALAFYNYIDDGSEHLNWRSLHTGLPATSTKYIANHWFRINSLLD